MTKKMTHTDKLYAMRPAELIEYAASIGVKLPRDKAGKNLKCSREKAVTKVIEAEMAARNAELPEEVAKFNAEQIVAEEQEMLTEHPTPEIEAETASDGTPYAEVMTEIVAGAEKKAKEAKAKKVRRKAKTFEELVADIPSLGNVTFTPNSKRTAVHVKRGSKRLFGYTGTVVVVNRPEYLEGIEYETRNYGMVVAPTKENMLAILKNAATA